MNFSKFLVKQRLNLIKTFHQKLFQPLDWGSCCIPIAASASADRERNPLSQSYSWKFCPSTKENCNFCIIRGTRFGAPQLVGLHVSKRLTGILLAMKRTYLGQSKWNTCAMGLVNTLHTQVLYPYVHKPIHYRAVGTVGEGPSAVRGGEAIPSNFGRYVSPICIRGAD